MGAYLPNRASCAEKMEHFVLGSFDELCRMAPAHVSLAFTSSCPQQSCSLERKCRSSVELASWFASFVFIFSLEFSSFWKYLPAANPVSEFFSHNTKRSHPELSALDSLSSQANKSLGMLSESEGRSLPSRLRCLLTLTLPFSVSHNKGSWRTRHKTWIGHSQSVTDHLRMYYTLLPKHDQKP